MDALTDLLDGPRARGAFMLRMMMSPPWSIVCRDRAPLSVLAMVRSHAYVHTEGREPVRVEPGDVAVTCGPNVYHVTGEPGTPVQVIIHPGQKCTTPDGRSLTEDMDLGVRSWGNDPGGSVEMLIGTYERRSAVTQRLLSALPPMLVLTADSWDSPLVGLLRQEIVKDEPGQEIVLDRLLDLLLIAVLRTWFSRPEGEAPGWYRAHGDPVVGPALRLLHDNLAHPWTVAELAAKAGVSRAALAQRFGRLVGEPPMAYLTGLRLAQAADLIRETDATLESVARQVGYGTAFALSTAFKRERGVSPQDYRARSG
ncbi:cupin domain-containing protein [Spirillospora sp. CA-255316]